VPLPDVNADNRFKDRLAAGSAVAGSFIMVGGPEVVEIGGATGLDFVILDTEHTATGWEKLSSMCLSATYSGTFPLVRIATTARDVVTRALDIGARGVMFAQIQDAAQALEASRACRYPPLGNRGAAMGRNAGWGIGRDLGTYVEGANKSVVCVVQVETRESVANVESIASVPGIDCLFIGLSDLSVDLGVAGQSRHPDVEAALDLVIAAARARGIAVGIPLADTSLVADYRRRGVSFFATTDRGSLAAGYGTYRAAITS
jgi:2-keto-3-deoxy-L-rhamnonate aldolase RhmA